MCAETDGAENVFSQSSLFNGQSFQSELSNWSFNSRIILYKKDISNRSDEPGDHGWLPGSKPSREGKPLVDFRQIDLSIQG